LYFIIFNVTQAALTSSIDIFSTIKIKNIMHLYSPQ